MPGSSTRAEGAFSDSADHHLWRNGEVWWVAFTIHYEPCRKRRIRRSLDTHDLIEARRRRDIFLRDYAQRPGVQLSLRFDGSRRTRSRREGIPAQPAA